MAAGDHGPRRAGCLQGTARPRSGRACELEKTKAAGTHGMVGHDPEYAGAVSGPVVIGSNRRTSLVSAIPRPVPGIPGKDAASGVGYFRGFFDRAETAAAVGSRRIWSHGITDGDFPGSS